MEKMFENGLKRKFRFKTDRGLVTMENLYDLNLRALNAIAKSLNKELKQDEEEDFLEENSKEFSETKMKFDIVLYILNSKKDEKKKKDQEQKKKLEKDKLLTLLEKKQDEKLETLSEEELRKKIESM